MTRPCTCDRCSKGGPYTINDCRLCWLYHNNVQYRRLWGGPEKGPGLFDRAVTFTRAVARHALDRGRNATEEQYQERLAICHGCDQFQDNRCLKCGCYVAGQVLSKARWASEDCPLGKWPKLKEEP